MDARQLLDLLAELASEAGIKVQVLPAAVAAEGEFLPRSGVCRVRDEVRVILAAGEPLEDHCSLSQRHVHRLCAPTELRSGRRGRRRR